MPYLLAVVLWVVVVKKAKEDGSGKVKCATRFNRAHYASRAKSKLTSLLALRTMDRNVKSRRLQFALHTMQVKGCQVLERGRQCCDPARGPPVEEHGRQCRKGSLRNGSNGAHYGKTLAREAYPSANPMLSRAKVAARSVVLTIDFNYVPLLCKRRTVTNLLTTTTNNNTRISISNLKRVLV